MLTTLKNVKRNMKKVAKNYGVLKEKNYQW